MTKKSNLRKEIDSALENAADKIADGVVYSLQGRSFSVNCIPWANRVEVYVDGECMGSDSESLLKILDNMCSGLEDFALDARPELKRLSSKLKELSKKIDAEISKSKT